MDTTKSISNWKLGKHFAVYVWTWLAYFTVYCLKLCVRMHARTHARTHALTHAHTHTHTHFISCVSMLQQRNINGYATLPEWNVFKKKSRFRECSGYAVIDLTVYKSFTDEWPVGPIIMLAFFNLNKFRGRLQCTQLCRVLPTKGQSFEITPSVHDHTNPARLALNHGMPVQNKGDIMMNTLTDKDY